MASLRNAMCFSKFLPMLLLAVLLVICSADKVRIHEHMTPEELLNVFHVDHPSHVPEYDVVQLTHSISRRHIQSQHPSNTVHGTNSKVAHDKVPLAKPISLHNDQMTSGPRIGEVKPDLADAVEMVFHDRTNDSDSDSANIGDSDDDSNDVHKLHFNAFGKKMELFLKKQDTLLKKDGLKMWTAVTNTSQPYGVDYLEMESDDEEIGDLYHDEANGAALLIRKDPKHGKLLVDGSIGHDLVIKPLPSTLSGAIPPEQDDEMFLDPSAMDDMVSIDTGLPIGRRRGPDGPIVSREGRERARRDLQGTHHVIFKRNHPAEDDHLGDYALMEPDRLSKRYKRSGESGPKSRRQRDAPYVIYPEILVIVDYDGYRLHGGDNVQIKRYFVSFWNGVDLRYKLLKGPRIRISIAGIIISRGRDATPYLERNRVGRDAIDSAAALTDMGKYLFRERRLPVYDIAVAVTKLDMCRRQYANDVCNRGTAGFAYVGGACVVNKRLEKVNSVAIIEDTGGFSGIIVAAHEVGHLLGAVHDGSPPPSYLGGPGAEKCRWEDGFIMSDLRHTEKGFRWSPCSVQSFHHFLNGDTATCLYNSPHEDESLPRVLPGRLLTLDAQCRKDRGTSACFKDERVCAQLFCFDAASGYCVAYRPAAEGSPCGDGQYCINGRCVAEHENIIPDYSQHTPSYVRRDTSPYYGTNGTLSRIEDDATPPYPENILYNYGTHSPASFTLSSSHEYPPTEPTYSQAYGSRATVFDESYPTNGFNFYLNMAETKPSPTILNPTTPKPTSRRSTTHRYNKYSITSTKSPYDFGDFYRSTSTKSDDYDYNSIDDGSKTTASPNPRPNFGRIGKFDFNTYFNWTTTRNPYDFNIYSDVKSNNIKRSYDTNAFYESANRVNVTSTRKVRVKKRRVSSTTALPHSRRTRRKHKTYHGKAHYARQNACDRHSLPSTLDFYRWCRIGDESAL